jgi:predicted DNA-binding transcriptional regulator AlpA
MKTQTSDNSIMATVAQAFLSVMMASQLLNESDVAGLLVISPETVKGWRASGQGPRYHRMGREVRYYLSDVRQWQRAHLVPVEPME